jgi:hypothetical protein
MDVIYHLNFRMLALDHFIVMHTGSIAVQNLTCDCQQLL